MQATQTDVINMDYLAKLSRIALGDAEKARLNREIGVILDYFELLKSVNVDGIAPSAHAFPVYNVLREDTTAPTLDVAALERIAPMFREGQVVVPRVVDDEG